MSRGSRELFHSDLVAWLLDTRRGRFLPILLRAARVDDVQPSASGAVRREFSSFDLLVDLDERTSLLVENKLKSVPRRAQLAQYAADADRALKGRAVRRVLLSPSPPLTQAQGADLVASGEWTHLPYARLADAVEELAGGEAGHEAWLLREYARAVRLLLELRDVCSVERTPLFVPGPDYEALRARRLHDLVYKWRYEELALAIEARLGERLYTGEGMATDEGAAGRVAVTTGFTNGTALVDLKAHACGLPRDRADAAPLVGVQLQHDRLRIVAENVSADTAQRLLFSEGARRALDGLWGALRLRERPRGERAMNRYGPWFHYRYVVVGEATLDEMADAMVRALDGMVAMGDETPGGAV